MTVQVVTVFAPREPSSDWNRYKDLIRLQRRTAKLFGHQHVIVTDADLGALGTQMRVSLPSALMPAMVAGVVERLRAAKAGAKHLVFVDADCLVNRSLDEIFDGSFDLLLTRRDDPVSPINNGAMYVHANGVERALVFFERALQVCREHWAADQEAISEVAAPVPTQDGVVEDRHGCRIRFDSMRLYAGVPKSHWKMMRRANPFVIHFKGREAKDWMPTYAANYVLNR